MIIFFIERPFFALPCSVLREGVGATSPHPTGSAATRLERLERSRRCGRSNGCRRGDEDHRGIAVGTAQVLLWSSAVVGGLAALYGLHRLALRLEDRGYLYYLRKKPSGSAAGCFVALQRAVEPQVQHVLFVRQEAPGDEGESAGSDRPSGTGHETAESSGGR
jgi:hypothetical protein